MTNRQAVTASLRDDYEQIPYPALCFAQTLPGRMATIGTLLGLEVTPVARCRVLELGCAVGGNIIPMAYAMPDSSFVGIDISVRQIEAGRKTVETLGLSNIRLEARDIRDITPDWGRFDYIIAHGIYSWVPGEVRSAVLRLCRQNLSAGGIAYISYNTLPGWHMLAAAREMMLYHTRGISDPSQKAQQARELIAFLADSIPERKDAYGSFLESYGNLLDQRRDKTGEKGDALLLHDELERVNVPFYFHQFAAHAAEHDLQYLGEAEFSAMLPANFKPQTMQWLQRTARDLIEIEQYMDFVRNRTFRQSLLCHAEQSVSRRLSPDPTFLARFHYSSRATPVEADADLAGPSPVQFRAPDGALLNTDHPVSKAAMMILALETPKAISFLDLFRQARGDVYGTAPATVPEEQDALALAANLLRSFTYSRQLVELHTHPTAFITDISRHPVASMYARLEALRGETQVTNLLHERVSLDSITLFLLPLADGSNDQAAMVARLRQFIEAGNATKQQDSESERAREILQEELEGEVRRGLQWLGRAALLIA